MTRADTAGERVVKQDRAAVGAEHDERKVRYIRHQRIRIIGTILPQNAAGMLLRGDAHQIAVDLAAADDTGAVEAGCQTEAAVVLQQVFRRVAAVVGKVEGIERRRADSSVPRCEGMTNAAGGTETIGGIVNQAVMIVFGKGHGASSLADAARLICRSNACIFCLNRTDTDHCARSSAPCAAAFSPCRRRRWWQRCPPRRARA